MPVVQIALKQGQMAGTLSNARQIHLATQAMSLDTMNAAGDHMDWTSINSNGTTTAASVSTYFDALIKNNYLSEQELRKLVTAPGKGPGSNAPTAQNSCFKFFQVDDASPSDQPLLVTANWEQKQLSDNTPYGKNGFVMFAKGGSGGIYPRATDVTSTALFPTAQGNGPAYRYNTLN